MGATPLVEEKIEAGKALVENLDAVGFPVRSAFWLYTSEDGTWRLVIASPRVREEGTRQAYRTIEAAIQRSPLSSTLSTGEISLVKDTEPIVRILSRAVKTDPIGTGRVRFTGNVVGGLLIDDAVIYRST